MRPLLIFDSGVLLAGKPVLWEEWGRFGLCVISPAVADHLREIAQQGGDPAQMATARAFERWQPNSHWQILPAEPTLTAVEAQGSLSSRGRQEQALAECAYTLAHRQAGSLVVLVSDEPRLRQRIHSLQVANLTAVSAAEGRGWMREQHRPAVIDQLLRQFPGVPLPAVSVTLAPVIREVSPVAHPQSPLPRASQQGATGWSLLGTTLSYVILGGSLLLLSTSALVVWRIVDQPGSQGFWHRWQLPEIPRLPR